MTLFLSYDHHFDWLEAIPFGVVADRQGHDRWRGVSDEFGWFLDRPDGEVVGFKVLEFSTFDPEHPDVAEIFEEPHFHVPALGLPRATAGEVALAAPAFLEGESTIDRVFFQAAMDTDGEEALRFWVMALQAGNLMAHYGAGYTLLGLERHREAYRHLRHYTELVPKDAWAWDYRARAAHALGERAEAVSCWRRAIDLEEDGGEETEARHRLG